MPRHPNTSSDPSARLRILIADDEPLARDRIRGFLSEYPAAEVVGEAGDGIRALSEIRSKNPDIVLLDVQMPGYDSFQLLAKLPADRRPALVLVTAHGRYALDAFAEQVVDYVLKPFDRERFDLALRRAFEHVRMRRACDLGTRLEGMLSGARARLAVKADGRVLFLRPEDIRWIEAENNYATLHLANNKRLLIRETLSSLERRLAAGGFTRVNRSALVRIDQVLELQPSKFGDYSVVLLDGTRLALSRGLRGKFEKTLSYEI